MLINKNSNSNYYSNIQKNQQAGQFTNTLCDSVRIKRPINYQNNKISFTSYISENVSINEINEVTKSTKNFLINAGKKISGLIKRDNPKQLQKFDGNLEEISKEMETRRKEINDDFFILRKNHHKRNIDKLESRTKEIILNEKAGLVDDSKKNAQKALEIAEGLPSELAKHDPAVDIERRKKTKAINNREVGLDELTEFSKIAGYEEQKAILDKYYIKKIEREKAGEDTEVPGSILFFGPTGNGKSTFAQAFAETTGCEIVPIEPNFDLDVTKLEKEKEFMEELKKEAEKAKIRFEKDGSRKRTIIYIDEITKVLDKTSSISSPFADFLNECSNKYHCTVFATTNHLLKPKSAEHNSELIVNIGLDMSKQTNFPYRVALDAPTNSLNRINAIEVLNHYFSNRVLGKIDYSLLAEELEKKAGDGAFSISQIKQLSLQDKNGIQSQDLVSHEEILSRIRDEKTVPAINKAALDKFKEEKKQFLTHKVKIINEV